MLYVKKKQLKVINMANPIANTVFKIKFNGQKIKVRILDDGERINSRCIQSSVVSYMTTLCNKDKSEVIQVRNEVLSSDNAIDKLKETDWHPCNCVGEKTDEHGHHHRVYLEVLSPFFTPLSNDSGTEPEDKGKADL